MRWPWVCGPAISPKFLLYALLAEGQHLLKFGKGTNHTTIYFPEVKAFHVCLAPRVEQDRIVEAIESRLSRIDAGISTLKRAQARLDTYRAAVLKAACEGRLVPTEAELARAEGRDYEPADRLLARIAQERRAQWEADILAKMALRKATNDRWREEYREPNGPDLTDVQKTPEGWSVASMDQLTTTITSGSRDWSKYYGEGSGTFLMAQNVRMGGLDLSSRQPVNPPENDRDRVRSQVKSNDLLVTIVGANTGDVCKVPRELRWTPLSRPESGDPSLLFRQALVAPTSR